MNVHPIPKNSANICGFSPHVLEACIASKPFDEDDIKLESDLTILLWQSSTDNMMLLAIGHIQLPDTKT